MLQLESRHRDHHPADGSHADMIRLPGGTFRMGSDRHYPDEAPVHRATIDGFWIDGTPITHRQFQHFVEATGYVTVAEIAPDPKDYPSALPRGPELRSLRAWDSNSTPGAQRVARIYARPTTVAATVRQRVTRSRSTLRRAMSASAASSERGRSNEQ